MKKISLVFIGGGIGSVCRHLISLLFEPLASYTFPLATFVANIVGCFVIGLLVGKVNLSNNLNLLLVTGFCGGFTTFSTFSKESLFLIKDQQISLAITYIFTSIIIGTLLVLAGYSITNKSKVVKNNLTKNN